MRDDDTTNFCVHTNRNVTRCLPSQDEKGILTAENSDRLQKIRK